MSATSRVVGMAMAAVAVLAVAAMACTSTATADWRGDRLADPHLLSRWSFSDGNGSQLPIGTSGPLVPDDKGSYDGKWSLAGRGGSLSAGYGPNLNLIPGVPGLPGSGGDLAADANWGWKGASNCSTGGGPAGYRGSNSVRFADLPNDGNLYPFIATGQDFSIEAWFRTREGTGNGIGEVPDAGHVFIDAYGQFGPKNAICGYGTTYDAPLVRWESRGVTPSAAYNLRIKRNSDGSGAVQFDMKGAQAIYPQAPLPNVWHQVAGVRSGGQMLLYYDGALVATTTAPAAHSSYGNGRFGLAGYYSEAYPTPFPGVIDDVSVLGDALTSDEVCDSYRGGMAQSGGEFGHCFADRFRPRLRFDTFETYRPLDVDFFFAERNDQGEPLHEVCVVAGCSALESSDDLPAAADSHIDIAGDGDAASYYSPYAECNGDALLRDCDSGPRSAIYYRTGGQIPTTSYYHDYWIFYRYNDWPTVAPPGTDHEGDWESITVASAGNDPGEFDFASFSQHGTWFSYLEENLSCGGQGAGSCGSGNSNLDVYVAQGSHANYPDECDNIFQLCAQNGTAYPEANHDGASLWGNDSDVTAMKAMPPSSASTSWTAWAGKWGAPPAYSPDGPAHGGNGDHWNAPWISDCADDNPDCPGTRASSARKRRSLRLRGNGRCGNWLGAGVVAAACAPRRLTTAVASRRIGRAGSFGLVRGRGRIAHSSQVSSTAPGLAQALGAPLRPGEQLTVRGRAPRGTRLLVRAATPSRAVTARFNDLGLQRGGRALVIVTALGQRPVLRLVRPDGRRLAPSRARRTVTAVGPAPEVLRAVRRGAGVHVRFAGPRHRVLISLSGRRRGDSLRERWVGRVRGGRTVAIRHMPGARFVRAVAFGARGARSRGVAVPIEHPGP
jgi:hypothetical protein